MFRFASPVFFLILIAIPVVLFIRNRMMTQPAMKMTTLDNSMNIPGSFYVNQTLHSIGYVDFFSGFIKTFFFAILIGWIFCYQGFNTRGGSLGVGRYTTKAVALAYIFVVVSNTILTKIILTFWG